MGAVGEEEDVRPVRHAGTVQDYQAVLRIQLLKYPLDVACGGQCQQANPIRARAQIVNANLFETVNRIGQRALLSSEVSKSGRAHCDTEIFVEGVTEGISQIEVDQEHSLAEPGSGERERPGELSLRIVSFCRRYEDRLVPRGIRPSHG